MSFNEDFPSQLGSFLGIGRFRTEAEQGVPSRELLTLPVTVLTTTAAVLYAVPVATVFQINSFVVTNYTAGALTFSIYVVPSGGSAANANLIFSQESVGAHSYFVSPERWAFVLPTGSTLEVLASANASLNILLSGMNVTGGDLM